jgi:glycosyltransferase involved in cell wall biosynthesis
VVVPSRWQEAFASVAIQAAQVARPTIVTDRGGMAEAVLDGETGLVVPSDDVEAVAGSVIRLLGDPSLAMELGRRARERARTLFSWDRYLDDFDALYARLVATWHSHESAVPA